MQPYLSIAPFLSYHPRIMFCSRCNAKTQHNIDPLYTVYTTEESRKKIGDVVIERPKGSARLLFTDTSSLSAIVQNTCIVCHQKTYDYHIIVHPDKHGDGATDQYYRIYPPSISADIPPPNEDMSEACKEIYQEAAHILPISPRASAALMRLCLQQFFKEQDIKGKSIDKQTEELVRMGMPTHIIQYIDTCRIIGNNGAHPGEINLNDNSDLASALFPIINIIIEHLVSNIQKAEKLYNTLPAGALQAAETRNTRIIEQERIDKTTPNAKDNNGTPIAITKQP